MESLFECVHWPFCPGFFIAILAFLAAVVTFRKEPTRIEKACWTVAFLALMVGEVSMMSKDRHAHEIADSRARDTEQDHFSKMLQMEKETEHIIQGAIDSERAAAQAELERTRHHKAADELIELKARTAKLASDIFQLLLNRSVGAPPYPRATTWKEDVARSDAFDHQTILLYEQNYGARVREVTEELRQNGLVDNKLETFVVPTPPNVLLVTEIARHLAAQAERITPDGIKPLNPFL